METGYESDLVVEDRFRRFVAVGILANAFVLMHALLSPTGAFPDHQNNLEVCSIWIPQCPLKPV